MTILFRRSFHGARTLSQVLGTTMAHAAEATDGTGAVQAQRWAQALQRVLQFEVKISGTAPVETALYVANHRSYLDVIALLSAIPGHFVAKSELSRWPLFGRAAAAGGTVFVDRGDRDDRRRVRAQIINTLRGGRSVFVFPEGTTYVEGLGAFKKGAFEIASEAGVPIVPITIEYGNLAVAWVGDDSFISHFMRTFGVEPVKAAVHIGTSILSDRPMDALASARQQMTQQIPRLRACLAV